MALPYFFTETIEDIDQALFLNEETSRHISGVLRMQNGEQVLLTDGNGKKAIAVITNDNRKKTAVQIVSVEKEKVLFPKVSIAISLIKNTSRFEWFLEKATEVGVNEIIPLVCERTEKEKFRFDRMKNILISAMLQSQQCWLPVMSEPVSFKEIISKSYSNKFIAHCFPEEKTQLAQILAARQLPATDSFIILVGPEGDFTPDEIEKALAKSFQPVALGNTRLRTETAGIVAATLLRYVNL